MRRFEKAFITFRCPQSLRTLAELPLHLHFEHPHVYAEKQRQGTLGRDDVCSLDLCHMGSLGRYFVRAMVGVVVRGAVEGTILHWGVWVEVDRHAFDRMIKVWKRVGRETSEAAIPCEMATSISLYEASTLGLRGKLLVQPVGFRPLVQVARASHPFTVDAVDGIPLSRLMSWWHVLNEIL